MPPHVFVDFGFFLHHIGIVDCTRIHQKYNFNAECSYMVAHFPLTNRQKHGKITRKGDEGECPGTDPVSEKWRKVQATSAEAGKYLYLLSRKEESF